MAASLQSVIYGVSTHDDGPVYSICPPGADNQLGPLISRACNRGFDFTLFFEQGVLSVGSSVIFLLFFLGRLWVLYGASKKVGPNYMRAVKIMTTGVYAALQLAVLVLWLREKSNLRTKATIPAAVLGLSVALSICVLSYIDHVRSVRPSAIIAVYSFFSLIFDTCQSRTLFLRRDSAPLVWVFTSGILVRIILLVLELPSKRSYLKEPYCNLGPSEISGIFNTCLLWWINPLIILGYKTFISPEDLPKLDSALSAALCRNELQQCWDNRGKPEGKYTLPLATLHAFKWTVIAGTPFRFGMIALSYCQPFIISRVISFVSDPVTENSKNDAIVLVFATVVVYVGLTLTTMQFYLIYVRLSTQVKAGLIGVVHNRSLTLQDGHYDESAAVTLMGTDTDQVSGSVGMVWDTWAIILDLVLGITLLQRQIGWACVMPIIFVIIASRTSAKVGDSIGSKQKAWSKATQQRIATTSSMLGSVKALKMMGLSDIIENNIKAQRVEEIRIAADFRWMIVYFNIAANGVLIYGPVGTFACFSIVAWWRGENSLSTNKAFTSLALINMVAQPATRILSLFPNIAAAGGCFSRIQKFLLDPSRQDERLGATVERYSTSNGHRKYVDEETQNGNGNGNGHHILDDPISNLAVAIRGVTVKPAPTAEPALVDVSMQIEKGSICLIAGPVGCGKSTLARAVLGELPTVKGDIEVSSRRIAYCAQTAWLHNGSIRDNICGPIEESKFDESWYETVLNACGLERDLSLLSDGDKSLIGSRGLVLSGGQKQRVALARAIYARADIVLLDDVLSALDAKTERFVIDKLISPEGLLHRVVVIGTDKKIAEQGSFDYLRSQEGYISKLLLKEDQDDKPTEKEEHIIMNNKSNRDPKEDAAADLARKTGDTAIYGYWLESVGWPIGVGFSLISISYALFLTFPQFWLKWWSEENGAHMLRYISGYFFLSMGASASNASIILIMLLVIGPRTSKSLHDTLLHTVMRAPQSFFSSTDTGVTLNRFSQDMNMVDRTLPFMAMTISMQIFKIMGQGFLLFSVQKYMLTTIPFVIGVVWIVQKVYLQTSRQLRFIDLEAKAPVYSQFLETLEGLGTIRAFGWEKEFSADNIVKLDKSLSPLYILACVQRWLNLVLDLIVAALAILVVILAVSFRGTTTGGQIGIALNVILSFNSVLLRLAEGYTSLETALGAVSRLKNFNEQTTPEDKLGEDHIPNDQWPEKGEIEFRAVTASYRPDAPALRNLSMKIAPGQKVGICGRTGSGKSSLLSTLVRLLDMDSGTIVIDGQDLQKLPRETIRTRIIAIPQDSFILSETVRINADPGGQVSDEKIIAALTRVGLWSVIEPRGGLEENMKSQPLSVGQQQLFCLARAMLRTSKILILDEATSNVDRETDQLMQKIIREEFSQHTIIAVAHRLDTILDSDVVAVLDAGTLVEFGNPQELLAQETSVFKSLYGR